MPRVFPEYKEQAKQKIVKSAVSAFGKKGYDHTTMEDIAKETGVSKSALYTYFQSKEDILAELMKSGFETSDRLTLEEVLDALLDESRDPTFVLAELYDIIVKNPDVMRLSFEAVASATYNKKLRKVLRDDLESDVAKISAYVKRLVAQGKIKPEMDVRTFALLFETLNFGLFAGICAGLDIEELQDVWIESTKLLAKTLGLDIRRTVVSKQ